MSVGRDRRGKGDGDVTGPVVRSTGLTKRFGEVTAVDDVSLALGRGEILSILGPSGCGKTTLLRLIAGFEVPDAGEIEVQGRLVSGRSGQVPPDRRGVGMVFQEYALFPHRTVAQNVSFGLQRLSGEEKRSRLAGVLELVRLTGLEERYPHELSGGQQQRVALARALAPRPAAILLDEPFSNLDADMRREMRSEVEQILREHGTATIFVTHDREEAYAMADRIGVMRSGRMEQVDRPGVVYHAPATRFVAQLSGTCDFLRARVEGGLAVTEFVSLALSSVNGPLPEGSQIDLVVRADDFQVRPDDDGACAVLHREFRGDEVMVTIGLPSGAIIRCRQDSSSRLSSGTRVALVPNKATAFPAFRAVDRSGTTNS